MSYYRIFLQKESDDAEVKDTIASFGMYVSESPFKPCDSVKEPTKRDWYDEDGDDEYIPAEGLRMQSYENKVKFLFKGDAFDATEKTKDFVEYLRTAGLMKMYCEFNQVGRQHVRLKSIDPTLYRDSTDGDILTLSVSFKFNDPITDIKPIATDLNGKITQLG